MEQQRTEPIKPGLKETPEDHRDFALGGLLGIVTLPALTELPPNYRLVAPGVKDQGQTDFCTAFSTDLLNEINEESAVQYCPEWGFAASKSLSGDPDEYGQDLRTALKRHVDLGALPKASSPFSLENRDQGFLRRFENWPTSLKELAVKQKEKSYTKITGPYDHFDNIKASMWKFRDEKRAVVMGIMWKWVLSQYKLAGGDDNGFGHAIAAIGWTEEGLLLQNSAGLGAGVQGCHVMDRASVNYFVGRYNAYMLVGMPREKVAFMLAHNLKIEDNFFTRFWKIIWK